VTMIECSEDTGGPKDVEGIT